MKIDELEIWGFGKLKNRKVDFSENLNVVFGENESGKSSLQWFILSMLFGMKGRRILTDGSSSPEKRFDPWYSERYGGLIKYTGQNNNTFTIERNFNKKSCTIYNENLEDITDTFGVTKTKGIDFFGKQFEMNEELFLRTTVIKQQEGKIEKKNKEELISHIVNIYQTGYEDISLKEAKALLKKTINESIGTNRTDKRPINVLDEKLKSIKEKLRNFSKIKESKKDLQENIKLLNNKNIKLENEIETLKKVLPIIEKIKKIDNAKKEWDIISSSHRRINDVLKENDDLVEKLLKIKIIEIEKTKEANNLEEILKKRGKKKSVFLILTISILTITIALSILNPIFLISTGILVVLTGYLFIVKVKLQKDRKRLVKELSDKKDIQETTQNIEEKLEYNKKGIQEKLSDISSYLNADIKTMDELSKRKQIVSEKLEKYEKELENFNNSDIKTNQLSEKEIIYTKIDSLNGEKMENLIALKGLETKLKSEMDGEEKEQILIEEKAELLDEKKNLLKLKEVLELSSKLLEESAIELKNDFTPRLIKEMGETVKKITNNKYSKLSTDSNLMLKVIESEDNSVRDVLNLSNGAIDQMYMVLRLALSSMISSNREKMPIIFDEPFMQFDDIRIRNSLEVLKEGFHDRQIILFTCKEREVEIISKIYKNDLKVINL